MSSTDRLPTADLPDSPQARQLQAGGPSLPPHRRSAGLSAGPTVAGGLSLAHLPSGTRKRIPTRPFRREPAAHAREPMFGRDHYHRLFRHGINRSRPRTQPHSQHDPHAGDHSYTARWTRGEFLRPTPPDLSAARGG